VGVNWAVGEDIFDYALSQYTASLVLLQNNFNSDARLDLAPLLIRFHFLSFDLRDL
jgi:hypothetical protein